MKKLICSILVLATMSTFVGCGGDSVSTDGSASVDENVSETVTTTEEVATTEEVTTTTTEAVTTIDSQVEELNTRISSFKVSAYSKSSTDLTRCYNDLKALKDDITSCSDTSSVNVSDYMSKVYDLTSAIGEYVSMSGKLADAAGDFLDDMSALSAAMNELDTSNAITQTYVIGDALEATMDSIDAYWTLARQCANVYGSEDAFNEVNEIDNELIQMLQDDLITNTVSAAVYGESTDLLKYQLSYSDIAIDVNQRAMNASQIYKDEVASYQQLVEDLSNLDMEGY